LTRANEEESKDGDRLLQQYPLPDHVYAPAVDRVRALARLDVADPTADAYLEERAAAQPAFKESLTRMVAFNMSPKARTGLLFILNALR
jgi:nitrous oxide reductase accessory protein NosL